MRQSGLLPCLAWAAIACVACASGHGAGTSSSATTGEQGAPSGSTASTGGAGSPTGSSGDQSTGVTTGAMSSGDVPGSTGSAAGATGGSSSGVESSGTVTASMSGSGSSGSATVDAGPGIDAAAHADASSPDGGHSNKVLIYTATTGFRHASIPAAATAIAAAATAAGLDPVLSPADPTKDTAPVPGDFATGALAPYGAVVLLATSGQPLGAPGTEQIQTLIDFVQGGGGLVAIEDASHCYDGDFPPVSAPYIGLIGGDFNGHTGFGPGTCATVGSHPTNVMLPATFPITDEVYYFKDAAPDIQVVLECENPGAAPRPISWVRTQGAGRVFYTALGHADPSWTTGPLVPDHVLPALLWTMGR
jgi:uncharacterized protein